MSVLAVDVERDLGRFALRASFAVPEGLSVVSGPSGVGKSLTLALVAGIERPDRGTIRLRGRTLDDSEQGVHLPSRERRVGIVFQDALLLPHRTVLDNVALAVRFGRRAERRREARYWLKQVEAEGLADAHPRTLSGGQRQRVSLARALAGNPELLLLDEPFSALDLDTRTRLRQLVRRIVTESGIPALFVTHDRDEAAELADTVVLYGPGRVCDIVTGERIAEALTGKAATRPGPAA